MLLSLGLPFFCTDAEAEDELSNGRLGRRAEGDGVAREGELGGSSTYRLEGSIWLPLRGRLRDDAGVDDEGSPTGDPMTIPAEIGLSVDKGGKFSAATADFRLRDRGSLPSCPSESVLSGMGGRGPSAVTSELPRRKPVAFVSSDGRRNDTPRERPVCSYVKAQRSDAGVGRLLLLPDPFGRGWKKIPAG